MKAKFILLAPAMILPVFISGCIAVGHDIKYSGPSSMLLGKTPRTDFPDKPDEDSITKTAEGETEELTYAYAFQWIGAGAHGKGLFLEFRNGLLNAYLYQSSFANDKTTVQQDLFKQVQAGISTKDDVLRILGEPPGKAMCPTDMPLFKGRCENGTEVWAWRSQVVKPAGFTEPALLETSTAFIAFDSGGTVTEVKIFAVQ